MAKRTSLGRGLALLEDMRIDGHNPLAVQLIEEARFGPGRFEPFGPPLRPAPACGLPEIRSPFVACPPPSLLGPPEPAWETTARQAWCPPPIPPACVEAASYRPVDQITVGRIIEKTVTQVQWRVGTLLDVMA